MNSTMTPKLVDDDFPPGMLLLLIHVIDIICSSVGVPQWRGYLPFGLGDVNSGGSFSHEPPYLKGFFPKLLSYADFLSEKKGPEASAFDLSAMIEFAKMPSTTLGDVTSNDAMVVLVLLVLIMRQLKAFLIPFFCQKGEDFGRKTHGQKWVKENGDRITKFGEYLFRLLYHSSVTIFGLWYFMDKPWWDEAQGGTSLLFKGYPNHSIETGMIWYYLIQCAYNVDAMISLVELSLDIQIHSPLSSSGDLLQSPVKIGWSPSCRGDFTEMFAHHIITNLLVIGSSYSRYTRIGSMVFLVHDISDVPVDLSKLANFLKWKATTVVCFVSLVTVWAVTRLGIFPFVIIKSTFVHSPLIIVDGISQAMHHMYIPLFQLLLIAITGLHVFWFGILIRIGYRLLTKNETHDFSEHKQGEHQGSSPMKVKKVT